MKISQVDAMPTPLVKWGPILHSLTIGKPIRIQFDDVRSAKHAATAILFAVRRKPDEFQGIKISRRRNNVYVGRFES